MTTGNALADHIVTLPSLASSGDEYGYIDYQYRDEFEPHQPALSEVFAAIAEHMPNLYDDESQLFQADDKWEFLNHFRRSIVSVVESGRTKEQIAKALSHQAATFIDYGCNAGTVPIGWDARDHYAIRLDRGTHWRSYDYDPTSRAAIRLVPRTTHDFGHENYWCPITAALDLIEDQDLIEGRFGCLTWAPITPNDGSIYLHKLNDNMLLDGIIPTEKWATEFKANGWTVAQDPLNE